MWALSEAGGVRRPLLLLAAFLLAALAVGWGSWRYLTGPADPRSTASVAVVVRPGATTAAVAGQLRARGLVRSALLFRLFVRRAGAGASLRPGRYLLSPRLDMAGLLAELRRGQPANNSLTIPEGYTLGQIADLLAAQDYVASAAAFLAAADGSDLAAGYLPPAAPLLHPLEGYLFPDTYQIDPGLSEAGLLTLMTRRTEQALTPAYRERAEALGLTVHELLTLASIVEAEAGLEAERALIAAVYWNRLHQGMRLDADPTVSYSAGKPPGEPPSAADLRSGSPYNTYRHAGLPPGPIGNPGEASIRAVLYPAAVPYLYFVARADRSGAHIFSRTLDEHNQAVAAQRQAPLE